MKIKELITNTEKVFSGFCIACEGNDRKCKNCNISAIKSEVINILKALESEDK